MSGARLAAAAALLAVGPAFAARAAAPAAAPIVLERPHPVQALVTLPSETEWEGCVLLLEGPEGRTAERTLAALCRTADGAPEIRPLVAGLAGARTLAADRLGDGRVRVLVGVPGGVRVVLLGSPAEPAETARSLDDARLDPTTLADRPDVDGDGTRDLLQATWEGLAAWRWAGDGFEPLAAVPLPRRATAAGGEVTVWGPTVMGGGEAALPRWSWPATWTGERLRIERIELGPRGAGPACSAWVAPGSRVQTAAAVVFGGDRPRLAALVEPADRIALLGERKLLVTPLVCRDSGRGEPPAQTLDTPLANYFAGATLQARDATGDGIEDLVAVGISGRLNPDLEVLVWPGEPGGGVARLPRRWSRKADSMGGGWTYEWDGDGDGLLDLVRRDERQVWVARGAAPAPGQVPLEKSPSFTATLPDGYAAGAAWWHAPPRREVAGDPGWILLSAQRASAGGGPAAHALIVFSLPPAAVRR
jgi:hypothetical protein